MSTTVDANLYISKIKEEILKDFDLPDGEFALLVTLKDSSFEQSMILDKDGAIEVRDTITRLLEKKLDNAG